MFSQNNQYRGIDCDGQTRCLLRARPKAERVLLRIRENPEYERPAGRGRAFERLIALEPKARLTSGLLWWVPAPPSLLPCMGPTPIAETWQYPLWHVASATWEMSQMFRLLFLGNGWADCVEFRHAFGDPLVTAYAVVTGEVSLHVLTCTSRFCI